jgi:hypothetical protein
VTPRLCLKLSTNASSRAFPRTTALSFNPRRLATMSAEEDAFFRHGWHDDDERIDIYALFVLEDVPVAVSLQESRLCSHQADRETLGH